MATDSLTSSGYIQGQRLVYAEHLMYKGHFICAPEVRMERKSMGT